MKASETLPVFRPGQWWASKRPLFMIKVVSISPENQILVWRPGYFGNHGDDQGELWTVASISDFLGPSATLQR